MAGVKGKVPYALLHCTVSCRLLGCGSANKRGRAGGGGGGSDLDAHPPPPQLNVGWRPPEGGLGSASDPQSRPPALAHGKGGRLHNLCRLGGHVGEEVAHSILGPERSHGGGGGVGTRPRYLRPEGEEGSPLMMPL